MGRYRIGEIVKNVGISSFSLKHYEKKGLLQPKTDESSGYRYYDVPDLGDLMWIHQMRSWNFTVKEIQHIQDVTSWDDSISVMTEKIKENDALSKRLLRANRCLTHRVQWAERAKQLSNQWEIVRIPAFDFLPHCRADELEPKAPLDTIQEWVQNRIDTYMGIRIPAEKAHTDLPGDAWWGFILFDHDKEDPLATSPADSIRFSECEECLVYYYSRPVAPLLTPSVAADGLDVLTKEKRKLCGDVYGIYLSEFFQNGVKYENYALFFPLARD